MKAELKIGDLVLVYSAALHGEMGIILGKRYKEPTQYHVMMLADHDYTMWYLGKRLRKIKH
jgi:hypothetical protein